MKISTALDLCCYCVFLFFFFEVCRRKFIVDILLVVFHFNFDNNFVVENILESYIKPFRPDPVSTSVPGHVDIVRRERDENEVDVTFS